MFNFVRKIFNFLYSLGVYGNVVKVNMTIPLEGIGAQTVHSSSICFSGMSQQEQCMTCYCFLLLSYRRMVTVNLTKAFHLLIPLR